MFNMKTRFRAVVLSCFSCVAALTAAGCVSGTLPLTDGTLAELIQSFTPSDNSPAIDDSSGSADDSSPSTSDGLRSDGSDSSQGFDDSPGSSDDGASSSTTGSTAVADQRLRAELRGGGAERGHADYRFEDGRRKFNLEVEHFAAGDYAVRLNGVEAFAISVGPLGTTEVEFDSKPEIDHTPFPAGFPSEIQTGDVVDVAGVVSGAFALDE